MASWDVGIAVVIWFFFVQIRNLALKEIDELFEGRKYTDGVFLDREHKVNVSAKAGVEVVVGEGKVKNEQ
jgi:hypothetical protein